MRNLKTKGTHNSYSTSPNHNTQVSQIRHVIYSLTCFTASARGLYLKQGSIRSWTSCSMRLSHDKWTKDSEGKV